MFYFIILFGFRYSRKSLPEKKNKQTNKKTRDAVAAKLIEYREDISEEKTEGTQYNCQLIEINFQNFTKTFNENLNI